MYGILIRTLLVAVLLATAAALELPFWQLFILAALAGLVWNLVERFRRKPDHPA